jgi:glucokinase
MQQDLPGSGPTGQGAGLIADIGGTNARFALVDADGRIHGRQTLSTAAHDTIDGAILEYLARCGVGAGPQRPRLATLGVATPLGGDEVAMTNHPWSFSVSALRATLGLEALLVANDFVALARMLPTLAPHEAVPIGLIGAPIEGRGAGSAATRHAPLHIPGRREMFAVAGPGTGLGVAALVTAEAGGPEAGAALLLASEGGHATYAAQDAREVRVVAFARERFGHVSAERLISGPGLELIHEALNGVVMHASDIAHVAAAGDEGALDSMDCLFAMLGAFAGSLALTLGAHGGVYIAGGIVPASLSLFEHSRFRERFEAKGRYAKWLHGVPTHVIVADEPGLRGAALLLGDLRAPHARAIAHSAGAMVLAQGS